MEKTIGQIQEEAEIVKIEVKKILKKFMHANPSICLSGEFGVSKEFISSIAHKPMLANIEVDLILKINIDEK
jgi:hypothetical protein